MDSFKDRSQEVPSPCEYRVSLVREKRNSSDRNADRRNDERPFVYRFVCHGPASVAVPRGRGGRTSRPRCPGHEGNPWTNMPISARVRVSDERTKEEAMLADSEAKGPT